MFSLFVAALSAGASLSAGGAQTDHYKREAAIRERQAQWETIKADYDVKRHRERTDRVISTQHNIFSTQGFAPSGTAQDVSVDSLSESEKDVMAIRLNAAIRASNYRLEAQDRMASASDAETAGYFNAASSLMKFGGSPAGGSFITKLGSSFFGG